MERTQELFERIEAYIDGTLLDKELVDFENEIKANPELKEQIKIHKELKINLKDQKSIDFRKKLINVSQELKKKKESKKSNSFSFWKIAASIVVLVGLSTFVWLNNGINHEQDLFATYYVSYPIGDIKRGSETNTNQDFKTIVLQYKAKEYQKVVAPLENLINQNPNDEVLKLCLGNSYINTNQFAKAESLFANFSKNSKHYTDALWFLSLTYLKMEKTDKTIPLLKELITYNSIYKKTATSLLKDLQEK